MNLLNKFIEYIFGEKLIPFDEFSKQLDDKLIEYGYKRGCGICGVSEYTLFYFSFNCVFFQIDHVCEQVIFVNTNPFDGFTNPFDGFTIFDKEKFTKTNLNLLFEKAKIFSKLEKKCRIQSKINEIEKDFI